MSRYTLHAGDCRDVLRDYPADHFDSIVTDPPYGLSFMGKGWDRGVPGEEFWREALRVAKPGAHLLAFGGTRTFHRLTVAIEDAGWEVRDVVCWLYGSGFPKSLNVGRGWGTALKPAWEPVIVARKRLDGTVSANVMRYGTGALNIDGCRIGTGEGVVTFDRSPRTTAGQVYDLGTVIGVRQSTLGRWPANLMHDGSPEVEGPLKQVSRFFYCAKASRADREEGNTHPTVKPTDLMRYLCRLVTPTDGLVLDPFCGSGSTGKGALLEGFRFVGIDLDPAHIAMAKARCQKAALEIPFSQMTLFHPSAS